MAAKHAILEINGERYEAHSGDWHAKNQAHKVARSIDGMISDTGVHAGLTPVARQPISNIVTRPTMSDIVRPGVNPTLSRQQPSQILMRQAVQKPTIKPAKRIKAQTVVKSIPAKRSAHTLQKKLSVANMNHMRAERALSVQKSGNVVRFAKHTPNQIHHADTPAIAHAPHPAMSMPRPKAAHVKHRTTNDIFEEALAHATGHEQVYHHKKRRGVPKQAVILVSSFVFVLVVSGVVASQNLGNVKMYLAASKAGFSAGLPNYQPSGYHLDKVNSSAGIVAANFLSNSDKERNYTLTQKPSKWDSQALREMFVSKNSSDFYTVEKNGLTIYIYGEHQATWVNGGVWYQLSGQGSLSDRQLVELASSF